ncbi:hypothetical protein [Pantoea ananatis]|uniref:hypothetical protein n=1 Tax=Pantoea ananas TaxID=553 RepID=UPI0011B80DF1|nr:hypothetical protein [Pantoea ananatis]UYL00386.1 hypothetical protein NG830_14140 [Pantoea ananatis]
MITLLVALYLSPVCVNIPAVGFNDGREKHVSSRIKLYEAGTPTFVRLPAGKRQRRTHSLAAETHPGSSYRPYPSRRTAGLLICARRQRDRLAKVIANATGQVLATRRYPQTEDTGLNDFLVFPFVRRPSQSKRNSHCGLLAG